MARFTVRIELVAKQGIKLDGEAYKLLHEKMGSKGFIDKIKMDDTGLVYDLPDAEYNMIKSGASKNQILNLAKSACFETKQLNTTIDSYRILVTVSNGRTTFNLKKSDSNFFPLQRNSLK